MILDTSDFFNLPTQIPETEFCEKPRGVHTEFIQEIKNRDDEEVDTTYSSLKKDYKTTSVASNKQSQNIVTMEFERWVGRVVNISEELIGAKLSNTQGRYADQYVEIKASVFEDNGIRKKLSFGDMFELRFDQVRKGKQLQYTRHLSMLNKPSAASTEEYIQELEKELSRFSIKL